MSDRVWNSGPPPHVGWWNARVLYSLVSNRWGWWNGEQWSIFATEDMKNEDASYCANTIGANKGGFLHVQWSDYYPENARVPRIDPRKA